MRIAVILLASLAIASLLGLGDVSAQSAPVAIQAIPLDLSVPIAPVPVSAEGRRHYLYELHLTNVGRTQLTLTRLEVIDERDAVVSASDGDALAGQMRTLGASDGGRAIAGGQTAIVFLDVAAPISAPLMHVLRHRLYLEPVRLEGGAEQTRLESRAIRVASQWPALLSPPLRGADWVTLNALSNVSSHRRTLIALEGRATIAQRFAVDFSRIGPDGLAFRGDPANNANWSPYGADVLAVANGRVVALRDGLAENDPTSDRKAIPISVDTATGNYLVLDLGAGRYALYAHLKPGSFHVRAGDRVRTGQVLAALGNSGKSDAPHLHFQIMDGPSPLASEGLPFELRSFEIEGHVASLSVLADGTGWRASGPPQHAVREMPTLNAVVAFPSAPR